MDHYVLRALKVTKINRGGYICKVFCISLFAMIFLSSEVSASGDKSTQKFKVGTNMLSLLLIGDVNASLEYTLNKRISFISTAHYVGSSKFVSAEGEGYRVSAGVRAYGSFRGGENGFMEFKTGLSHYDSDQGVNLSGDGAPLSIEFYGGLNDDFNEFLFYELKLGLIRFLQSGNIAMGGGFNVGLKF